MTKHRPQTVNARQNGGQRHQQDWKTGTQNRTCAKAVPF
jgi:hypothetical protein